VHGCASVPVLASHSTIFADGRTGAKPEVSVAAIHRTVSLLVAP
jgi:hypothetical protein